MARSYPRQAPTLPSPNGGRVLSSALSSVVFKSWRDGGATADCRPQESESNDPPP
jgi:hypothetical protein